MAKWIRFEQDGKTGFGTLDDGIITVHSGDMFAGAKPSGQTLKLSDVQIMTPCEPSKMICLWNNFHQLAAKNDFTEPKEPLWFLKAPNAYWPANRPIERPAKPTPARSSTRANSASSSAGSASTSREAEAGDYIFGYTCVNDVTAVDLLRKDKSFEQWARAKSFDTFGVFGPVIATGLDPLELSVKTILNGKERQNYPVADMFFPPHRLVAAISQRHDADAGRRHRLRHLARRRHDGRRPQRRRHRDRRRRQPRQRVRPGAAEPVSAGRASQTEEDLRGRRRRHRRPARGQIRARAARTSR